MMVARRRKGRRLAIAAARKDQAELCIEAHSGFGDGGLPPDRVPRRLGFFRPMNPGLALAVITIAARLEEDRRAERL